jgi:hypothetical protein
MEQSIGPRLLARFAASAAMSNRTWHIFHGYADGALTGDAVRGELFRPFAGIDLPVWRDEPLERHPALPYWFIVDHERDPVAAFDLDHGRSWLPGQDGPGTRLLELYRSEDSALDPVLLRVTRPVE